jgi:hypothetical protein
MFLRGQSHQVAHHAVGIAAGAKLHHPKPENVHHVKRGALAQVAVKDTIRTLEAA